MDSTSELLDVAEKFMIDSKPISCKKFGNGHINKTYEILTEKGGHYILQTVNSYVFKDVEMLMKNIFYVSNYLISKGQESLEIIKTKNGKLYYQGIDKFYRIYVFLKDSLCIEKAEADSPFIKSTSEAYGDLHMNLAGLDASKLGETIPDFHNTPKRFENFLNALDINFDSRKDLCQKEINFILKYKEKYSVIVDALNNKEINVSVIHNDPKINNVLFDSKTKKFRCVIDLDTVMPGSILYDFGDGLRSLFTGDNECSKDLSKLKVNFELYQNYLFGYASKMKKVFTPKEIELLPFSVFLLTIELGIRFLDDFLRGDIYFHINEKDDNLTRAKTQITLAQDIMDNIEKLNNITKEIINSI